MVPLIPSELLLTIFSYADGPTLARCHQVCKHWANLINHYDSLVWRYCCQHDFQRGMKRRFWSLDFPNPTQIDKALFNTRSSQVNHLHHQGNDNTNQDYNSDPPPIIRWQDLYRITTYWTLGQCQATFLNSSSDHHYQNILSQTSKPCLVIGSTQENNFLTTFTTTASGRLIRSNPTYKGSNGHQRLKLHHILKKDKEVMHYDYIEDRFNHGIVCHYSDPTSHWIVTGGLDGSVSLWDEVSLSLKKIWNGHRGRVLCVSMNDQVIISGGSDSMIRVWDLDDDGQRGSIDISSYLSDRQDWFQGVGEVALNGHLIVCAPDASGPVLIFSLLTGSLVYELKTEPQDVVYTRLCLTPYYLLTKGEYNVSNQHQVPIYPASSSYATFKPSPSSTKQSGFLIHHGHSSNSPSSSHLNITATPSSTSTSTARTPYQLIRDSNFASLLTERNDHQQQQRKTCIDVWDLQTGKLSYRLLPPFSDQNTIASIIDIRISPHAAHVFACIEIRNDTLQRSLVLCCWDFSNQTFPLPTVIAVPSSSSSPSNNNTTWACFY